VRDSFRRLSSLLDSDDNLVVRIRANFREALRTAPWKVTSANGASIHLVEAAHSPRTGRAQGISFLTHAVVIAILAALSLHPASRRVLTGKLPIVLPQLKYNPPLLRNDSAVKPSLGQGSGEGHDLTPPRTGLPAPVSAIQIVKPSIPPKQDIHLPVPPSIPDPNAANVLRPVEQLGIPGGPDTDSSGVGKGETVGSSRGHNVGNGPTDGTGVGDESGPFRAAAMLPTCLYCPTPVYTEEARETKLQGLVTLAVLVTADGHATDMRVTKGLGAGLDERAMQTVRGWRFSPARDAARRPVAAWVTIEVVFRLF
jgi:periplasmic protein TonB